MLSRLDSLSRRIRELEVKRPDADRSKTRAFLAKLTDEELDRYGEIALRYESGIEPTEEEWHFFAELEAKYGYEKRSS